MTQEVDIEISPLGQALTQLETALAAYDAEPQNAFIRDAVVQRFEFTYELSIRLLRRYLRETAASEDEVDEMTFKELIRKGEMLKLLRSGVPEWSDFRQARTDTVHTYNESRAQEVASVAKDFALEARVLFANLSRRLSND